MRLFLAVSTRLLFLCSQLRNNDKLEKMSVVMSCHVTTTGASVEEQKNAWKAVKLLCEQPQYRNIIMLRYTRTANKFDSWKDNLKNLAIELRRKGRESPSVSPPSSFTPPSFMTASPMRSLLSQVTSAPAPSPDTAQDSPKSDSSSELSPKEQTSSPPLSYRSAVDESDFKEEAKLLTKTLSTPIVAPPALPSPLKRSPPRGAASQSSPDLSLFRKEPPVLQCGDSYVVEYIGDHRIMHRFSKDIERVFAENNCSVSVTVGENIVKNDPNSPRARTLSMERLPTVVDRK